MRLPLLLASAFSLLSFAGASAAPQGVPDPRNSTTDRVVVGNASGTPMGGMPAGYDVVVRDVNNTPLVGQVVVLDFSSTGIRLYSRQNAGTTVNCALKTISRVTDGAGAVSFAPRIGRFDNTNSVEVLAMGVLLALAPGRSTDIDGLGGETSLGDFVLFAMNYNTPALETDFDLSGDTGLGDFLLFASEYEAVEAQPYCP